MQVAINGLLNGALYALVAAGLSLIFGILQVPDFAIGSRLMVGAYAAFFAIVDGHVNYWIGVLVGVLAAALLGAVSELLVYRHLRRAPAVAGFIGALGLLTGIEAIAQMLWTANPRGMPSPYGSGVLRIGSLRIVEQNLVAAVAAVVLIGSLWYYTRSTMNGRAMRAISDDRVGAQLVGISTNRIALLAIIMGSAMAGAAGVLIAPLNSVYPTMADSTVILAFIVIVLSGMQATLGALIGGFVVGLFQSFASRYISVGYTDIYAFVILIAVLLLKPEGLFGKRLSER